MNEIISLDELAQRFDRETALEMYKAQFSPISQDDAELAIIEEETWITQ